MEAKIPVSNPDGAMAVYKEYCRMQIEIGNGKKRSRLAVDGRLLTYREAFKVLSKKQLDLQRLKLLY